MEDIAELARGLALVVSQGLTERAERDAGWRLVVQFVDDHRRATRPERGRLLRAEPCTTASTRWDAFLAALAEELSRQDGADPPAWVYRPERTLERWWFPSGYESLHATALQESPGPFAIRGIFITGGALARV